MWYKLGIFLMIFMIFVGCSTKSTDYYNWKSKNIIIHDKVLDLSKTIKIREVKYFTINKKNWMDGTTSYTEKVDKYI